MNKLRKRFYNSPIRFKLGVMFAITTIFIFVVNIFMYFNINQMTQRLDEIYKSNVQLNDLSDALESVQGSMTDYLNTKTSDAMEDYYKNEQNLQVLLEGLEDEVTDNSLKLLERNIRRMSESYLKLTDSTIEAKRGRNVERYKAYYEQASKLCYYLEVYIASLNEERFRINTDSYVVLSGALTYLEYISILIFAGLAILDIILASLITRSITTPLQELSEAANKVAEGDVYQVETVSVHSMDEVGVVAVAFNQMALAIPRYMNQIRESMEKEQAMKERELLMETHLKDAQLRVLQAQINPHFLFNTLNAGAQLAMLEDADRTYDYIQNVAAFFRYNIKKNNDEVSIADEIRLVDNYIYILNVRFSGDIHFSKEIEEDLLAVKVPSMILQPLVENSVNYGIRDIDWEGKITLSVYRVDDHICLSVYDNGLGMTKQRIEEVLSKNAGPDGRASDSNGVGLTNVMERLTLYFEGKSQFEIESEGYGKGTEVVITIPYQEI